VVYKFDKQRVFFPVLSGLEYIGVEEGDRMIDYGRNHKEFLRLLREKSTTTDPNRAMEIHYRMKELNEEYLSSLKKSEPESKAAPIRCPHCGNLFRL